MHTCVYDVAVSGASPCPMETFMNHVYEIGDYTQPSAWTWKDYVTITHSFCYKISRRCWVQFLFVIMRTNFD